MSRFECKNATCAGLPSLEVGVPEPIEQSSKKSAASRCLRRIAVVADSKLPGSILEIDLLLSNIQMPGMTGIELATQIKIERPAIRVLLMSGFDSGLLVLNSGWRFLHKPFLAAELATIVAETLRSPTSIEAVYESRSPKLHM